VIGTFAVVIAGLTFSVWMKAPPGILHPSHAGALPREH